MASLVIDNVTKTFGRVRVLKGINIAVEPGEFLVLVGPSGCGKSTLLNLIAGLETITTGEIRMGDRVVNLQSDLGCAPCLNRTCRYRGEPLNWRGEVVQPACYAQLSPELVRDEAMKLLERSEAQR